MYPVAPPYARVIADRLDGAHIVWNGPAANTLGQTVIGRSVDRLLQLVAAGRLSRTGVFDLLATAPVRHDGQPVPTALWEKVARAAGIHEGRAEYWVGRIEAWGALGRNRGYAPAARALSSFIERLTTGLEQLRSARTWAASARELQRLAVMLLGPEAERATWHRPEQQAADSFDAALHTLASLDTVDPRPDLARFRRAVLHLLDAPAPRRGRLGEGVLVGPLSAAIGLDLELVIVVGAAEGLLPMVSADDPIIPDAARRRSQLPTAQDRLARQHREFLAALSAGQRIVITRPRGDLRQTVVRTRSRWLDALEISSLRSEERRVGKECA